MQVNGRLWADTSCSVCGRKSWKPAERTLCITCWCSSSRPMSYMVKRANTLDPRALVAGPFGEFKWWKWGKNGTVAIWQFKTEKAKRDFIRAHGGETYDEGSYLGEFEDH